MDAQAFIAHVLLVDSSTGEASFDAYAPAPPMAGQTALVQNGQRLCPDGRTRS
jgi:hypothetical protein